MRILSAAAIGLLLSACGSMHTTSASSDATAYAKLAVAASHDVTSYCDATATMSTSDQCKATVDGYAARMQDMIDGMKAMAGRMDDQMKTMGQVAAGDMQCGTQVMGQELAQHIAAACTASDMATNHAEAARHCSAMQGYTNHMQMRAAEMMSLDEQSGGMMGSSGMMNGGWQMPDGGMMSWDHTIAGCAPPSGSTSTDGGMPTDGGMAGMQ